MISSPIVRLILVSMLVTCATQIEAAINQSNSHQGQTLIFPYFNVRAGWSTLIQVVNNSDSAKAYKVNIRDARNGQRVLTFNLYLGGNDSWSGSVFDPEGDDSGVGALTTMDRSCTVPTIIDNPALPIGASGHPYVGFRTLELDDGRSDAVGFDGLEDETREGYVVIHELGVVNGEHAEWVEQSDCHQLVNSWSVGGAWASNGSADMSSHEGSSFGEFALVHAMDARAASARAVAIDGVFTGQVHSEPGADSPSLNRPDIADTNVSLSSVLISDGEAFEIQWKRSIDAVTATLMAYQLVNRYSTGALMGTSWVATAPTRFSYVNVSQPAIAPFSEKYGQTNPGESCEPVTAEGYDQEGERFYEVGSKRSTSLCYAANLIGFNGTQPLASPLGQNIEVSSDNGWLKLQTLSQTLTFGSGVSEHFMGLPWVGFALTSFTADQIVQGIVRNYAMITIHGGGGRFGD